MASETVQNPETSLECSKRPAYEQPTIKVMSESEVLSAFQMTAAEISAAGCWWTSTSWTR